MIATDVFVCDRIWKYRTSDIEKGDIGWIPSYELPDIISRCAIFLSDVKRWYEEKSEYHQYKENNILAVVMTDDSELTIICPFENFTMMMCEYRKSVVNFKHN